MTINTATTNADFGIRPNRYQDKSLSSQVLEILTENDIAPPALEHVDLIGRYAEQAQVCFFSAAIAEPTGEQLSSFFDWFVRSCAGT